VQKFLKVNRFAFVTALFVRLFIVKLFKRKKVELSDEEVKILDTLKRDGIVVIPNYFSSDDCITMRKEFDTFVDKHSLYCPEHERRIFGIDKLSDRVRNIFSSDSLSWKVCEAYLGEEMILQTTMSARIDYKEGIEYGSGGSWHRDSYSRQIKSIAYLTDMTEENGPFMYIKGSHKFFNIVKDILNRRQKPANFSRYTDTEIEIYTKRFKENITYFPCKAGTLILADIRGLHTTRYLRSGFAYSIFNYYIAKYDDNFKNSDLGQIESKCINGEDVKKN